MDSIQRKIAADKVVLLLQQDNIQLTDHEHKELVDMRTEQDNVSTDETIAVRVMTQLYTVKPISKFDMKYFINLHKAVFKDIEAEAGHFRNRDFESVMPFGEIKKSMKKMFNESAVADGFHNFEFAGVVNTLTDLFTDLNYICPFAAGSHIVQKIFLQQLTCQSKYDLDFSKCSVADMQEAYSCRGRVEFRFMREMIMSCLSEKEA